MTSSTSASLSIAPRGPRGLVRGHRVRADAALLAQPRADVVREAEVGDVVAVEVADLRAGRR